ncbi:hypothetical protein H0H81_010991 [Sphagnurus paluster]|uniref:Uncharacterized protein n=1 Tax=Sphagnurus paluster TaxID=117069 RepID=A0A9P7GPQ8_9AGAR|nr:hypothetical protein H0H81_010991 [Sphagnurus paluster]
MSYKPDGKAKHEVPVPIIALEDVQSKSPPTVDDKTNDNATRLSAGRKGKWKESTVGPARVDGYSEHPDGPCPTCGREPIRQEAQLHSIVDMLNEFLEKGTPVFKDWKDWDRPIRFQFLLGGFKRLTEHCRDGVTPGPHLFSDSYTSKFKDLHYWITKYLPARFSWNNRPLQLGDGVVMYLITLGEAFYEVFVETVDGVMMRALENKHARQGHSLDVADFDFFKGVPLTAEQLSSVEKLLRASAVDSITQLQISSTPLTAPQARPSKPMPKRRKAVAASKAGPTTSSKVITRSAKRKADALLEPGDELPFASLPPPTRPRKRQATDANRASSSGRPISIRSTQVQGSTEAPSTGSPTAIRAPSRVEKSVPVTLSAAALGAMNVAFTFVSPSQSAPQDTTSLPPRPLSMVELAAIHPIVPPPESDTDAGADPGLETARGYETDATVVGMSVLNVSFKTEDSSVSRTPTPLPVPAHPRTGGKVWSTLLQNLPPMRPTSPPAGVPLSLVDGDDDTDVTTPVLRSQALVQVEATSDVHNPVLDYSDTESMSSSDHSEDDSLLCTPLAPRDPSPPVTA